MIPLDYIEMMEHRILWVNERVLRTWVADLIQMVKDVGKQLVEARADIARLELEVAGWRAIAERNAPKFVNKEHKGCYCGGIGCLGCCGQQ